jgi:peptidase M28-like protein
MRYPQVASALALRALSAIGVTVCVLSLSPACVPTYDAAEDLLQTPELQPQPIAVDVDPLSAAALRAHVEFLVELEPARSFGNPKSLERAAQYVADAFEVAGGRVARQEFEVQGESYSNVRAFFGPESGARLIIGAHYDSFGDLPGADDNASGTAVLIALASALKGVELTRPVELVAYTLEEPPNYDTRDMGSARHAQLMVDEKAAVHGMICLEMLGYYSDEPDSQTYPAEGMELIYGTKADFLAVVGRPTDQELVELVHTAMQGTPLRVEKLLAPPGVTGVDFSDHRSYWEAGFQATMITDTAFFRNAHYHEPTDTPDTLDYERMAHAVQGVLAATLALAGPE